MVHQLKEFVCAHTDCNLVAWDGFRLAAAALSACALVLIYVGRSRWSLPWTLANACALFLSIASLYFPPVSLVSVSTLAIAASLFLMALAKERGYRQLRSFHAWLPIACLAGCILFQWSWASFASEREIVLDAMRRRPDDLWPRGGAHALVSTYGAPESRKAYIEAGGSFSPFVGSFGLSFWVLDEHGLVVATSDTLPVSEVAHAYHMSDVGLPQVHVQSPFYELDISLTESDHRVISVNSARMPASYSLIAVLRSVGPAGGPIRDLRRLGDDLLVNDRWVIGVPSGARVVGMGREGNVGWKLQHATVPDAISSHQGWGYAMILLPSQSSPVTMEIRDTRSPEGPAKRFPVAENEVTVDGFPESFASSISAQRFAIKMGLVGNETRPGDPYSYPIAWLRDGAYSIVALCRSGDLRIVRDLAAAFVKDDFFGGFGAEADAPGLTLWVIGETSRILGDPTYDAAMWPHVERRVKLVREMLEATRPVRKAFAGPVVPAHARDPDLDLVSEPAERGLPDGRMDWRQPKFFIAAISYLGLNEASEFAARHGRRAEAAEILEMAERLRTDYRIAFADASRNAQDLAEERTFISGLWPSNIADPEQYGTRFRAAMAGLQTEAGIPNARPDWTYFSLAQAHQWLWLGEPERASAMLQWFADEDPIPGLHVYWEGGSGGGNEGDVFGLWRGIRGNVKPSSVTPHYWSAAESLLLSLDMLALARPETNSIVIGAGVPRQWLNRPLSAKNVRTPLGRISWWWDGQKLKVESSGSATIVAGPSFTGVELLVSRSGSSFPHPD